MSWKNEAFKNFKLYAVTDLKAGFAEADFLKRAEDACRGGIDVLQLRAKDMADGEILALAVKLRRMTEQHKVLFFINDRPDLALAAEADGVHVGQEDMPLEAVRKVLAGRKLWLGKSTHRLVELLAAQEQGADYIGVGPVYATPTKPGYKQVGLELVAEAAASVRIPFVAIGGIDSSNVEAVLQAGASRIAVVRAVFNAREPYEAARQLCSKLEGIAHV